MSLEDFVTAGVFDPSAANADDRRALLEHLLGRGFSVESIISAAAETLPTHIASRLSRPWQPTLSLRTAAARAGVDLDVVVRMRLASGFAVGDLDAVDLPDFIIDDIVMFQYACTAFGEDAVIALMRVLASSAERVVDATRSIFGEAMRDRSATELEISQASEESNQMWPAITAGLLNLVRLKASSGYDLMSSLLQAEVNVGVAFVDLVGSTEWRHERSESEANEALKVFERHAWNAAVEESARLVKLIGDEAMIVAPSVEAVCRAVVELCRKIDAEPSLPAARGAVGFGAVTAREGDYTGAVVNVASRATKEAPSGAIVVTTEVLTHLDRTCWRISSLGRRVLRGIPGSVELFEVRNIERS